MRHSTSCLLLDRLQCADQSVSVIAASNCSDRCNMIVPFCYTLLPLIHTSRRLWQCWCWYCLIQLSVCFSPAGASSPVPPAARAARPCCPPPLRPSRSPTELRSLELLCLTGNLHNFTYHDLHQHPALSSPTPTTLIQLKCRDCRLYWVDNHRQHCEIDWDLWAALFTWPVQSTQ